jgi:hypothetical protein
MTASRIDLRLRVFIASPGDVADERRLARQILGQLPYDPLLRGRVAIEIVAWDQPGGGAPMYATVTPQKAIEAGLPKPSDCDVVVLVLWSRMGTPLPPEYTKPDGSRYLSGTEWEYLDAVDGNARSGRPDVFVYRRTEEPPVTMNSQLLEKFDQWQKVNAFFETFRNPDGSIRGSVNEYATPEAFGERLEQDLRGVIARRLQETAVSPAGAAPASERPALWAGSPFPGLRAFTPDDAPIFFGRRRETVELVRRLADGHRFILVVGASGAGKSSVVAAGLLPALQDDAIPGSKDWLLPAAFAATASQRKQWTGLRCTPGELGDDPFLALAARLVPMLPNEARAPTIAELLKTDPSAFSGFASALLGNRPAWAEVVLFIDQLEELFSVVAEQYRSPFVEMLVAAVRTPRARVLATLRADFYHRCLEWPDLSELLRAASFPLARPGIGALTEMIAGPAARAGLELEPDLVTRILDDTGLDPGALPLLGFALHELYERRTGDGRLTHAAYQEFGGVNGVIGRRAEKTFAALPEHAQALFGVLFRELVDVNEHGLALRRRVPLSRLTGAQMQQLVDAFTDARLLVTDRVGSLEPFVDVAHEALLREWPQLARWIAETADDLRTWRQAGSAAAEWARFDRALHLRWPHERLKFVYEAAERLGIDRSTVEEPVKTFIRPESEELLEELLRAETTHYRRAEIGDRLDRIGDSRAGVGVLPDNTPDIAWCAIAGGSVTLEDGGGAFDVADFLVSTYPVTYRQFRAFLDDPHGYGNPRWWEGLDRAAAPPAQYRSTDNCPADNVSWHDATAFCRWLSDKLNREITLPTEWEWQQMANGGAAKEYPWGNAWDSGRANSYESRLSRSTAVGMFPAGRTTHGALDVAGNVWEWCSNGYEKPQSQGPHSMRALRGGSWSDGRDACRCAGRFGYDPGVRLNLVGFRVRCAAVVTEPVGSQPESLPVYRPRRRTPLGATRRRSTNRRRAS